MFILPLYDEGIYFKTWYFTNQCNFICLDIDGMGKPQSGFRLGNLAWLGSYSECMNLTEARYCLAGVKITIPPGNQVSVLWLISMLITYRSAFDPFNPLWCWYFVTNLQGKFLLSKICSPAGSAKHSFRELT